MKQLVKRMSKREPKKKKAIKSGLSQKDRFIAYAKNVEADENGETFERDFTKIVPAKKKPVDK